MDKQNRVIHLEEHEAVTNLAVRTYKLQVTGLVLNYGISNTTVLEIP